MISMVDLVLEREGKIMLWLGAILIVCIVITTLTGVITLPAALKAATNAQSAANAATAIERNTDLTNCRAQARSAYDKAQSVASDTKAQVDFTTNQGLAAALRGDQELANEIATRADGERQAALDAANAANAAQQAYQANIAQAITDPDTFIKNCHAVTLGEGD